jgi:hypothetical protein
LVELHPLNFNEVENPNQCLDMFKESGALVEDIYGNILTSIDTDNFTQAIAKWVSK